MTSLEKALNLKYRIAVYPVKNYWIAAFPKLGISVCSAVGESPSEAVRGLQNMKKVIFSYLVEGNFEFPAPDPLSDVPFFKDTDVE
jgi:predicted RNase H-like HicB family nuclease